MSGIHQSLIDAVRALAPDFVREHGVPEDLVDFLREWRRHEVNRAANAIAAQAEYLQGRADAEGCTAPWWFRSRAAAMREAADIARRELFR